MSCLKNGMTWSFLRIYDVLRNVSHLVESATAGISTWLRKATFNERNMGGIE